MSKNRPPPVPPAGRSDKGHGNAPEAERPADRASDADASRRRDIDRQGRQGNVAENTRNQGYQQDR